MTDTSSSTVRMLWVKEVQVITCVIACILNRSTGEFEYLNTNRIIPVVFLNAFKNRLYNFKIVYFLKGQEESCALQQMLQISFFKK